MKPLWQNVLFGLLAAALWVGIGTYQKMGRGMAFQDAALSEVLGGVLVLVAFVIIRQMAQRPR